MQLGIFAKTFDGKDPGEIFRAARAAGYETVQFNMACAGLAALPDDIPPGIAAAVRSASAETPIAIAAVSATYNMVHPDVEQRRAGLHKLQIIASAASQMGTQLITLCTGTRDPLDQWRHHPDNNSIEAWDDLIYEMHKAVAIAAEYNVQLGIEPEHANVVCDANAAKRLITAIASTRIRVVIDPANLVAADSFIEQHAIIAHAVELLGPHICMAHAKDRKRNGDVASVGRGDIDFAHFIKCLRNTNFDGPLITHGLTAAEAPGVCQHLQGLLAK